MSAQRVARRWAVVAVVAAMGARGEEAVADARGAARAAQTPERRAPVDEDAAPQGDWQPPRQLDTGEVDDALVFVASRRHVVAGQLDRARRARDAPRAACLDNVLSPMDATLRLAREQHARFVARDATAATRDHARAILTGVRGRAVTLAAEAQRCERAEPPGVARGPAARRPADDVASDPVSVDDATAYPPAEPVFGLVPLTGPLR